MRTAIFFGAVMIACAINDEEYSPAVVQFVGWTIIIMMCMDIADFFKELFKK